MLIATTPLTVTTVLAPTCPAAVGSAICWMVTTWAWFCPPVPAWAEVVLAADEPPVLLPVAVSLLRQAARLEPSARAPVRAVVQTKTRVLFVFMRLLEGTAEGRRPRHMAVSLP